jgi:cyclohexa-1,5-dienecarbonyl-CoA hydratase
MEQAYRFCACVRLPTVSTPESASVSVAIQAREGVAHITLDRPPLNVLDLETLRRLNAALRQCDVPAVRVVLLSSALPRTFSAGVEIRDHAAARLDAMLTEVRENARLLLNLRPLTLAALRGSTLGGGAEIALLCDLAIAADDTTLGFPELSIGAFPPIAAACLPERCGWTLALRLLLGESIDAVTAERAGLVRQVVPADQLSSAALKLAEALADYSAVALRALTNATRIQRAPAILQRLDAALATYRATLGSSHDAAEGIAAFLEKRPPVWSHR